MALARPHERHFFISLLPALSMSLAEDVQGLHEEMAFRHHPEGSIMAPKSSFELMVMFPLQAESSGKPKEELLLTTLALSCSWHAARAVQGVCPLGL